MHAAVILAHPRPDSYAHALAQRAVDGLQIAGHSVDLVDLYAEGFQAAMTEAEREAYHGEEPILDPLVQASADLVRRVDALIFVYPTWWSGLPAILKGWIDRVMVPGVGFTFDGRTGKARPSLTNVRHLIGVSTYGSPKSLVRIINDNGRRTIMRALRLSCGFRVQTRWHGLYAIDTSTIEQRAEFAARVERSMTELR
ncbi:MAG: NAD(P)H dehydrogenase (quinone) [Ilumatobacter sp.]